MRFDFTVQRDNTGAWYVECPQIPGLSAVNRNFPEVLESAAAGIRDLALAVAFEVADDKAPFSIFKGHNT